MKKILLIGVILSGAWTLPVLDAAQPDPVLPASPKAADPEIEQALAKSTERMQRSFDAGEQRSVEGTRLLEVNGRKVEIASGGSGKYTVVFESGLGVGLPAWQKFASQIEGQAKWVCYSRAGYRSSDAVPGVRTPRKIAEELHETLIAGGFKPPFILVGHSYGGLCVRVYAALYPDQVAGLVLEDPSYERSNQNLKQIAPDLFKTLTFVPPNMAAPIKAEIAGMDGIYDTARLDVDAPEPDIPTAILTAMAPPAEASATLRPIFLKLAESKYLAHTGLLKGRRESMHLVTSRSSHIIHSDEPELVLSAIRWAMR